METKPISPKTHCLIDYAMIASLLIVPTVFKFNRKVKEIYAGEAIALLAYVALTDSPVSVKPLIPFPLHGKIDSLNMGLFALHGLLKPFKKDKNAFIFNLGFAAMTGISVLLTDWDGRTKKEEI
jgi:hypothetical protein